jgi:hypothetical protein
MAVEIFLSALGWSCAKEVFKLEEKFDPAKAIGGLLGSLASQKLSEWGVGQLSTLAGKIAGKPLPITRNLQDAVYHSMLLAGMEVVKCCLRNYSYPNSNIPERLKYLIDFQQQEIRSLKNRTGVQYSILNKQDTADTFNWQLIEGSADTSTGSLALKLADHLVEKIKPELYSVFGSDELPGDFEALLKEGWFEQGTHFTFFGFMCGYFRDIYATNGPVKDLLEKRWLQAVTDQVKAIQDNQHAFNEMLTRIEGHSLEQVGCLRQILVAVNPQPAIRFDYREESLSQKVLFRTRYVPFYGRHHEMDKCISFFHDQQPFRWWVISGSGGTGKSRLAMELCYELSYTHNLLAGFIDRDELFRFDWARWNPLVSTVIIIDYASTCHEKLAELIRILSRRQFKYPVRLLLLERELTGIWWDDLKQRFSLFEDIPKPWQEPLRLEELGDDFIWNIFQFTLENHGKPLPDKAATLQRFYAIDDKKRPLFALFAALAIAQDVDIDGWSKIQLLELYLQREEVKFWTPRCPDKKLLEKYKNLAALATIGGGFDTADLQNLLAKHYPWLPADEISADIYEVFAHIDREKKHPFRPFEPDILGEYFVLRQLKPDQNIVSLDTGRALVIVRESWENKFFETVFFTLRVFQDFLDNPDKDILISVPETMNNTFTRRWWLALLVEVIALYIKANQQEKALELYNKMTGLDRYADRGDLFLRQGTAALLLVAAFNETTPAINAQIYDTTRRMAVFNRNREVLLAKVEMALKFLQYDVAGVYVRLPYGLENDLQTMLNMSSDIELIGKIAEAYRYFIVRHLVKRDRDRIATSVKKLVDLSQAKPIDGTQAELLKACWTLLLDEYGRAIVGINIQEIHRRTSRLIRGWTDQGILQQLIYDALWLLDNTSYYDFEYEIKKKTVTLFDILEDLYKVEKQITKNKNEATANVITYTTRMLQYISQSRQQGLFEEAVQLCKAFNNNDNPDEVQSRHFELIAKCELRNAANLYRLSVHGDYKAFLQISEILQAENQNPSIILFVEYCTQRIKTLLEYRMPSKAISYLRNIEMVLLYSQADEIVRSFAQAIEDYITSQSGSNLLSIYTCVQKLCATSTTASTATPKFKCIEHFLSAGSTAVEIEDSTLLEILGGALMPIAAKYNLRPSYFSIQLFLNAIKDNKITYQVNKQHIEVAKLVVFDPLNGHHYSQAECREIISQAEAKYIK